MDPNTLFLLIIGGASGYAALRRFWPGRAAAAPDVDQRGALVAHNGATGQDGAPPEIPSWLGAAPLRTSVAQVRLSALARLDNVAIVGPKGSGKTTILRTLAGLRRGELVAFDPDNSPGKWPAITFGGGSRFEQIAFAFTRLDSAMRARSEDLDAGRVTDEAFPLRTLVSDEFYAISQELKARQRGDKNIADVGTLLLRRLVRGRKYRDCVLCATHNDTLLALGLPDGAADMKSCFDVFVYLGAMVRLRCKDEAVRDAALQMSHPAVVFDTERGFWYALEIDTPLMTKEQRYPIQPDVSLSVSSGLSEADEGADLEQADRQTADRQTDSRQTDPSVALQRDILAKALIRQNVGRDKLRAALQEVGLGFDNAEYTRWSEEVER